MIEGERTILTINCTQHGNKPSVQRAGFGFCLLFFLVTLHMVSRNVQHFSKPQTIGFNLKYQDVDTNTQQEKF